MASLSDYSWSFLKTKGHATSSHCTFPDTDCKIKACVNKTRHFPTKNAVTRDFPFTPCSQFIKLRCSDIPGRFTEIQISKAIHFFSLKKKKIPSLLVNSSERKRLWVNYQGLRAESKNDDLPDSISPPSSPTQAARRSGKFPWVGTFLRAMMRLPVRPHWVRTWSPVGTAERTLSVLWVLTWAEGYSFVFCILLYPFV